MFVGLYISKTINGRLHSFLTMWGLDLSMQNTVTVIIMHLKRCFPYPDCKNEEG